MESERNYREGLAYWLQYPFPVIGVQSTESERLWHSFLFQKRLALQAFIA